MQILTKEKWKLFKQDGKLFESLIEELLQAEYPKANFKHTSWTRDGGKDFEGGFSFLNGDIKAWVECKYHKDTLPIQDVSMTLFMAYIESAQVIIFFSYSPVNSEFQKYIDLYQKKSEKNIKIFDDLALEELILKNKDKIKFKKYFGDFSTEQSVSVQGITYKYWVHSKNQNQSLHLNELVRLEFCAANHTSKELALNIKIQHNKYSEYFEIINSTINLDKYIEIKLPPNGIAGETIDLRLSKYTQKLKYPFVVIKNNEDETRLTIENSVECLWLAEVPLLGIENKLFIKKLPIFLNTDSTNFGMIVGGSGTGKSRIINEITSVTTSLQYTRIAFDADILSHLSAKSFFRELFAQLENIPELSHITSEEVETKYLSAQEYNDYTKFALKILFDNNISFADVKEDLVDYLLYNLSTKKYFLSLDNIQFYDTDILTVFQTLIEKHEKLLSSFILFSANTDYVYDNTLSDKLISQMKLMESKFPEKFVFKPIKGFDEVEAFEYLQMCLNENQNSEKEIFPYEQTLKKIIKVFGTNPLFLQNYLIYLYQEGIIRQTYYASYFIEDIDKLQKSFTEIPDKIYNLLKLREKRFIADNIPQELMEKYVTFVSYLAFARWLPYSMITTLVDLPISIICSMEKIGLLKRNDKNEYGFYHHQIEEYYKCQYPYDKMSPEALKRFCDVGLKQINRKTYIECIFLAQYILNQVDNDIWEALVLKICSNDIGHQKTYDICVAASNILDNISLAKLPDKYIEIYTHMTNLLTDRNGIFYAQKLYKPVYDRFCLKPETFKDWLTDLIAMMKSYIINELHLNHSHTSLKISQRIISILEKNYSKEEKLNEMLLDIYESQIFIYNEQQELEKALAVSDLSITLSEKTDITKLISAWLIRGDIYYTNILSYKFKKDFCKCWEKAQKLYEKSDIKVENYYFKTALYLNVYMRVVLLHIIREDFQASIEYMNILKKYIKKTKMPFFEIKLRHLLVCFEIFSNKKDFELLSHYEKLSLYLKESIDICAVYGSQTLYIDCFHMLAILQRICSKTNYAIDNYQKCYSLLQKLIRKQENSLHWIHLILDITIAMRQLGFKSKLPPHIWQLASSNSDIKDVVYSVCNIADEKFIEYLETMQITSPIYYEDKFIHFPKI